MANPELLATKRNLRVLAVLMRWGYGRPERGPSGEECWFLGSLSAHCKEVQPFWYDEYLNDLPLLERMLEERVEAYKPDLIFFTTYTEQFRVEFLDHLKSRYDTVAWFGDDQWRFDNYTAYYAPHFRTCITTDRWAIPKYRACGANVVLSQWAADYTSAVSEPLRSDSDFRYDVSFVGACNEVRRWYVHQLKRQGIPVACFGPGWPAGQLPYDEIAPLFRRSRINLNLSNSVQRDVRFVLGGPRNFARWLVSRKRVEQMKARNFEIPLAGGFQLSNYAPTLEDYFDIGKEIAIFTSPEECGEWIRYFLLNPNERYAMALRAHKRAAAEHTSFHRIENILSEMYGSLPSNLAATPLNQ